MDKFIRVSGLLMLLCSVIAFVLLVSAALLHSLPMAFFGLVFYVLAGIILTIGVFYCD